MRYCQQCGSPLPHDARQNMKFCANAGRCKQAFYRNKKQRKTLRIEHPLLHYFGGKWRLAQWIIQHMPQHKLYVEPYGGAASVLLQKPPSAAEVYNDLDKQIFNLMQVVKYHFDALEHRLKYTLFHRAEYDLSLEPTDDMVEQAARTLVRGWFSYGSNGLHRRTGFRTNITDTAQPAKTWRAFVQQIERIRDRLAGVQMECADANDVIVGHDSADTLFYVDPPYVMDTRGNRSVYTHEMSDDDHRQLAAMLNGAKGMVILSGYPSALYDELYPGWRVVSLDTYAESGKRVTEQLWLNPAVQDKLPDGKQLGLWE